MENEKQGILSCKRVDGMVVPLFTYTQTCLERGVFPLCLLPGVFPQLGLVLSMRESAYGPVVRVLCLDTGTVEEHDPLLLDPVDPR